MMTVFYVLLGLYFLFRGARESAFWGGSKVIEGVLMFLAGLFLLIAQIL
jgi:uncharacterized membrane protein